MLFLLKLFGVGLFLSLAVEASWLIRHKMTKSHWLMWGLPYVLFLLNFHVWAYNSHAWGRYFILTWQGVPSSLVRPSIGDIYFPEKEILVGSQMRCLLFFRFILMKSNYNLSISILRSFSWSSNGKRFNVSHPHSHMASMVTMAHTLSHNALSKSFWVLLCALIKLATLH